MDHVSKVMLNQHWAITEINHTTLKRRHTLYSGQRKNRKIDNRPLLYNWCYHVEKGKYPKTSKISLVSAIRMPLTSTGTRTPLILPRFQCTSPFSNRLDIPIIGMVYSLYILSTKYMCFGIGNGNSQLFLYLHKFGIFSDKL